MTDYTDFLAMKQEIGLLVVFLLVFLYDLFGPRKAVTPEGYRTVRGTSALTVTLFALFTVFGFLCCIPGHCLLCNACTSESNIEVFGGMYVTTPVVATIKNILNIGVFIVLIQSLRWTSSSLQIMRRAEFYELLLITLFGMYLMISARHFLLFVIGLECASLPLAAMVAFDKKREESHEAAIKYILTALFSSAILMLGISFVYGLSGSLYFNEISQKIGEDSGMLIVAMAFVMAGIGFKLSLVPFHLWTADVYQGAPTSVTSYLSVISKGATAFAFFVVMVQAFGQFYSAAWEWMLFALIVTTITVGNLFAIRQRNMKRFLAFSSVSQAGYIMLGIIGVNEMSLAAMMFYILVYIFSNLAAFGVIQSIENKTGMVDISAYRGLSKTNPKLAFCMMLAMFSLAGIPPFAGFFSKFFIFTGALNQGTVAMYVLVLVALINTIISLYYYLLVVKAMYISTDPSPVPAYRSACSERFALVVTVGGIILLGIVSVFYNSLLNLCMVG